ncbi:B12-binding domain-containing radical SAM protein [Enterovirga rhinocerotis]|uniref:B12-binding domain-containing radical SAM protein n=1 Tax=Enterovirga rhinocerotis TaxID=1339210 RepID=UPI001AAC4B77|nr:B12-binding domain-containing radical SAM protein [Enterovirga rhinocerotis]
MAAPTRVLLVFPRFNPNSFWSLTAACEVWGARCTAPPLGLITLAALLPQDWDLRLVNRNAEDLTDADIEAVDLVLTGGMLPQRPDAIHLVERCQALGKPVAIGGPDVSSSPEAYECADFRVIGEAEGVIDEFVAAWSSGAREGVFEAQKFQADVTRSPLPRFDLLNFDHYLFVGLQFSRGCPFTCEFCDIIELYGRVPRTKTTEQVLAELDRLLALGYRGHVDFVDDNLIGNKKAVKLFLPHLKAWQERHGYPFMFSTEASLNLADDAELLLMMREANFFTVFVGIETPDEAALIQMRKKQNTRRSVPDSVARIEAAGMAVTAGFIVGLDGEGDGVSDSIATCIQASNIPMAMVGLLTALPNTQLTRRLASEGRLQADFAIEQTDGDQCTAGLNFATLRPRRDILADYREVISRVFAPDAYFARVRGLAATLDRAPYLPPFSWRALRRDLTALSRALYRFTRTHPDFAKPFWSTFWFCLRTNPRALQILLINMVIYLHLGPFSRYVVRQLDEQIEAIDAGRWIEPRPLDADRAVA